MIQKSSTTGVQAYLFKSTPPATATIYFLDGDGKASITEAVADRRLSNIRFDLHTGGGEAAAARGRPIKSDLLIVEFDQGPDRLLELVRHVAANCSANTKAIVIGPVNDARLFRELISLGVSDYLVAPLCGSTLTEAIGRIASSFSLKTGRSVAFVGAKGGAGTSTLVQNIGCCINDETDKTTAILDTHLGFGACRLLLNANPTATIANMPTKVGQLDDGIVRKLMTPFSDRLSLLAAPEQFDTWPHITDEALANLVAITQTLVDCVLIDLPSYWNNTTRRLLRNADDVVIVASPNLIGLRNTRFLVEAIRTLRGNEQAPHLILNATSDLRGSVISADEFKKLGGVAPASVVQFDPDGCEGALIAGQPLIRFKPKKQFSLSIKQLCRAMDLIPSAGRKMGIKLSILSGRRKVD